MTEEWQRIVEFIRSTNASDVYLNRCSVKGRVDGKVARLSSADDFTEDAFETAYQGARQKQARFAAGPGYGNAVFGFFD